VMGNHSRAVLRRAAGSLLVAACLTQAAAAVAQSNSGVAQSLFEEGVRLMREKKYADACPKLAESHKLEPGGGTVFNLAICLEEEGKLASAYVAYDEALARAKKDNNTKRQQTVEQRMAALKPRLSRVTITVANQSDVSTKVEVRFDGTALGEQAWGVPFYADVGTHTITADAPGHKQFRSELKVETGGSQYAAKVPALERDANAAVAGSPTPASEAPKEKPKDEGPVVVAAPEGRGALPWILVGTGVALIGTGAVTGILAFGKHSDSDAECPDGRCTAKGVDLENQANTFAWISNITLPLGIIAGGVGAYLLIRKPSPSATTAKASARIAPTPTGFVLQGAF
jgi:hypothetical protein